MFYVRFLLFEFYWYQLYKDVLHYLDNNVLYPFLSFSYILCLLYAFNHLDDIVLYNVLSYVWY